MDGAPQLSIITPTYNRKEALIRAVRSVQTQWWVGDYEHIVIDDGSEDDSAQAIDQCRDHRLVFDRFACNRGANTARNRGLELARGEWISFLDSDDEYLPYRLEHLAATISQNPDTKLFISSFRSVKSNRTSDCINGDAFLDGPQLERALMTYQLKIAGSAITVRKDVVKQIGGFAPHLMRLQDRQLLLELSKSCGVLCLSRIDWIKHCSPDSISEQPEGYIEAVDELLDVQNDLAVKYRRLVGYHVARTLVKRCLQSDLSSAVAAWRANVDARNLKFGIWELCCDYVHGKRTRRFPVPLGAVSPHENA